MADDVASLDKKVDAPKDDDPIAAQFNTVPKFVVSRTLTDPSWEGTTVLADVTTEVRALKDRFDDQHHPFRPTPAFAWQATTTAASTPPTARPPCR